MIRRWLAGFGLALALSVDGWGCAGSASSCYLEDGWTCCEGTCTCDGVARLIEGARYECVPRDEP